MKTLKGKISIGRIESNQEEHWIRISVEDLSSMVRFAQIDLSLAEFSKAITGIGGCECKIHIGGLNLVGKTLEAKRELVYIPIGPSTVSVEVVFNIFEVDGWIGDRKDINNHHNRRPEKDKRGYNCYEVLFHRYV